MSSKTRPQGIEVETPSKQSPKKTNLLWSLSVVLSVLVSGAVALGFIGKTLYVTRDEFSQREIRYEHDKTVTEQTLTHVEALLQRQESAFQRLSDSVQSLKLDVAERSSSVPTRRAAR